jgi:hypothetical protein
MTPELRETLFVFLACYGSFWVYITHSSLGALVNIIDKSQGGGSL